VKIGHSTVIQATDGNLWVTNPNTHLWGTVYTITPTGTLLQTLAFSGSVAHGVVAATRCSYVFERIAR